MVAVKNTLTILFQGPDEERMLLQRAGSGNIETLILHHGMRHDHRSGGVAADLSVCFTHSNLKKVLPWWKESSTLVRYITCEPADCELFHRFVQLMASRAKDADSWAVPPRRAPVPAHLRPYFVRLLFPPLYAPDHTLKEKKGDLAEKAWTAQGLRPERSRLEKLKSLEEEGASLVRQARHGDAIERFQSGMVCYLTNGDEEREAGETPLAPLCYLNMAHCLLAGRNPAKAEDVETCCRAALKLFGNPDGGGTPALLAKAHYRMGLARELCWDREGAAETMSAALRCTPGEPTIQAAMERLQL
jgi:hypothetical protein